MDLGSREMGSTLIRQHDKDTAQRGTIRDKSLKAINLLRNDGKEQDPLWGQVANP